MKAASRVFLKKFKFSSNTAFILEFGDKYIRFYANHGQVINGTFVYEIETPYTMDDLWDEEEKVCRLQVIQNADVLYLWHKKYMKTLTRHGNTDWRLEDFKLVNGPWENMNTTDVELSADGRTGEVKVSATGDIFDETRDVGRLIRLNLYNDSTTPWAASKTVSSGDVYTSDGKYYEATSGGTTGSVKPVHTEGARSDGGVTWKYVHAGYGVVEIKSVTNAHEAQATVINEIPKNMSTPNWEWGVFHRGAEYPVSGAFWRNRLALLANTATGLKCFISKTDDFNNFADKEQGEVLAECAVTAPILSEQYNEARWLSSGDALFIGTNNGEFYVDTQTSSEAFGPENVKVVPISNVGSKAITPIKINGHTLFVDRYGTTIRDLMYSYDRDGYDPFDATIKGKHLLQSGIVEWDYQDCPDKVLWCVVADGRVIGFTFNTEQEVTALHQHKYSGMVESVAVIPSPSEKKDDLWVSVKRTIDNMSQRYVEWVDEGTPVVFPEYIEATDDFDEKDDLEADYMKQNSIFMDSCLVFDREPGNEGTQVFGLEHLAGQTVRIMADGAQKEDQVVTLEGTITINKNDNHVVVGLPVKSVFKAKKRYIQSQGSFGIGDVQQIDHLCLMLYRSGGGKVGGKFKNLVDILYRNTDAKMGKSYKLFTGNKIITWPNGVTDLEERGADIIIQNDSVFPMTVLAVSPQMTSNGD
jgi:hypothetical protein